MLIDIYCGEVKDIIPTIVWFGNIPFSSGPGLALGLIKMGNRSASLQMVPLVQNTKLKNT